MKHCSFVTSAIFLFSILSVLLAASAAFASDQLTIGAIQATGATADDEFIALQNPTGQSIDIGSWSIQYKSASGATYYKKNFVKGASVAANGQYVVCGPGYAGTCDMKHSSFSLSANGGTVFLVSNQVLLTSTTDAAIVDQKTYGAQPDTVAEMPITNNEIQNQASTTVPAPKQADTQRIVINEFLPAPTEGDEWIELYNPTGYALDLAGWTMADGTGKNFVTLDGLILPQGFRLIELATAHLNNSGDLVSLRDAEKREIDAVAYGDWDKGTANAPVGNDGVAVARIGDGRDTNLDNSDFALTSTATPGATNRITPVTNDASTAAKTPLAPSSPKRGSASNDLQWLADLLSSKNSDLASLLRADNVIIINNLYLGSDTDKPLTAATVAPKAAKTTAAKTATATNTATTKTVKAKPQAKIANAVEGIIIVPAGIVGQDIAVVREADHSVEVRLPKGLKVMPIAGDLIKTNGAWSTAKTLTLPRLLVKTGTAVTVIGHQTPIEPAPIALSDAEEHLGELVSVTGKIVEKQPTRFRLADNDRSVLIKEALVAALGDQVAASGLIVKNGNDFTLTPISPDALVVVKPPVAPAKSAVAAAAPYGLAVVPAAILSTAAYFGKKLKKKKALAEDGRKGGDAS